MAKKPPKSKLDKPATDEDDVFEQSAVNLRKSDWKLLRKVAEARADKQPEAQLAATGHRKRSVSAVIAGLIEDRRKRLEKEVEE
jgi:hypothetical protein